MRVIRFLHPLNQLGKTQPQPRLICRALHAQHVCAEAVGAVRVQVTTYLSLARLLHGTKQNELILPKLPACSGQLQRVLSDSIVIGPTVTPLQLTAFWLVFRVCGILPGRLLVLKTVMYIHHHWQRIKSLELSL